MPYPGCPSCPSCPSVSICIHLYPSGWFDCVQVKRHPGTLLSCSTTPIVLHSDAHAAAAAAAAACLSVCLTAFLSRTCTQFSLPPSSLYCILCTGPRERDGERDSGKRAFGIKPAAAAQNTPDQLVLVTKAR